MCSIVPADSSFIQAYIRDLEDKVKNYDESSVTSSGSISDLRRELAKYRDTESHSTQYIADLEARLARADESVLTLRDTVEQLEQDQYGTVWPFYRLDTTIGLPARLCAPCKNVVEEAYQRERAEAWDRLPETFSLPSWDELRKARDSALEEG